MDSRLHPLSIACCVLFALIGLCAQKVRRDKQRCASELFTNTASTWSCEAGGGLQWGVTANMAYLASLSGLKGGNNS